MFEARYKNQADLLLRILPYVADEKDLALKGGTAINLFIREMPRLSVDIDLVYLPFNQRDSALRAIADSLERVAKHIQAAIPGLHITKRPQPEQGDVKLICQLDQALVKIEVNTVMRGHLWDVRTLQLVQSAQDTFGKFAAIQVISQPELYGGKICAALDRQHPRDLFDIRVLLDHEGLSQDLFQGYLVALLSHNRRFHHLIRPDLKDQRDLFNTQFRGMARHHFEYDDFNATREQLIQTISRWFTARERDFLISFLQGEPNWDLFPIPNLADLPAIQWRLLNIEKVKQNDPESHARQIKALYACFQDNG